MTDIRPIAGSFRDPGGCLFFKGKKVYRTVTSQAVEDFDFVENTGLIQKLEKNHQIVWSKKVSKSVLGSDGKEAHYVLEHERIPFISYPYEWPFSLLKAAAVLQLDILLEALNHNVTLSDASAYNIQFIGTRPIFIDRLSFIRYREGQIWVGYRQFCEQFLFPLMLACYCDIPYHAWYRGEVEGIPLGATAKIIPFGKKFAPGVFKNITMQNLLQTRAGDIGKEKNAEILKKFQLSRKIFKRNLESLKKLISGLNLKTGPPSEWEDYDKDHSYSSAEEKAKAAFIASFCQKTKPKMVWDLGCNTCAYSGKALTCGADYTVGFDADLGALEKGVARSRSKNLTLLPLYMKLTNVSPSQGWNQHERDGLFERKNADGILALALIHHLAISGNVPLSQIVNWLVDLAPVGVIEFVPKNDAMVKRLLAIREDIFTDYTIEDFRTYLKRGTKIVAEETISKSGRTLFWYQRR